MDIKLYNSDCLEILKTMESNSIDLAVIDPPYEFSSVHGGGHSETKIENIKKN